MIVRSVFTVSCPSRGAAATEIAGNDALCSAFTAAIKTELSDEKELPKLHAD